MSRAGVARLLLIISIFVLVNVVPMNLRSARAADITLKIYPESPDNFLYLGSDVTITVEISNSSNDPKEVKLWLDNHPEDMTVIGRDGLELPFRTDLAGKEDYYYSVAVVPSDNASLGVIGFVVTDLENNVLSASHLSLSVLAPKLGAENLAAKITEHGLSENARTLLIPRYRRYWHPENSDIGDAEVGYIWLIGGSSANVLLDGNSNEVIAENVRLPEQIAGPAYGEARVWNGSRFESVRVPVTEVTGDLSYTDTRFELYYAEWDSRPTWVVRRSFYWETGVEPIEMAGGPLNEIPDTERIELWISASDGEKLSTISDFHFHAFRYDPVDSYTILRNMHCPLPSDIGWQMWLSAIANYDNVYPEAEISYDHIGTTPYVHPLTRSLLEEYWPLVKRNLIGLGLVCLVFVIPPVWRTYKRRRSQS